MPPPTKREETGAAPDSQPVRFEDALRELEQIVGRLEDGQLGLEESLSAYERGVRYLRQCYRLLDSAEQRIQLLQQVGPEGTAVTEAFTDGDATDTEPSLEMKAQQRSRRRSRPADQRPPKTSSRPPDVDGSGRLF